MSNDLRVDRKRLRQNLLTLAEFGSETDRAGVHRPSFSSADMAARQWMLETMATAGLETRMDGAGNVFGRWGVGTSPAILVGSHLDSVPAGGIFDGALGVCAGLECVRTMKDAGLEPKVPIEILATSEEEGRFGGMLGSQAICGTITRKWLDQAYDDSGVLLRDAMGRHGLTPESVLAAGRTPESVRAFLELHVEQGPVLANSGEQIGIVEGISGVFNWTVTLTGVANHAGTTPMTLRNDAFMGLADFAHTIPAIVRAHGTDQTRVTVGKVGVEPNFPHTVPGRVMFSLIGRDMSETVMDEMASACRRELRASADMHGLQMEVAEQSWLAPAPCDPEIMRIFRQVTDTLGYRSRTMPSGAGHDTQTMSTFTRAGMIFVPSVGGISHSPDEWTEWEDVERGANVLLAALAQLSIDCPRLHSEETPPGS